MHSKQIDSEFFASGDSYRNDKGGAVAVEFALLYIPFVMFMVGILELSLMFTTDVVLHGSTSDAARLIRTGQVQQTDGDAVQMFEDALCDYASVLIDCDNIQYEVTTLDSFNDADLEPEVDEDGNLVATPFEPGGIREITMIRSIYHYEFLTPLIGDFFSDYPGNKKMLMATIILETEPYDFED